MTIDRFLLATAIVVGVIAALVSCFPAAKQVEAAAGYEAQQMRCVDQYAKRADIDACRAKVRDAWASDAAVDAEGGAR